MKKLIIPIVAVAAFIVAVGFLVQKTNTNSPIQSPTPQPAPTVTIRNVTINVELAKTNEEREKGLSDRTSLNKNSGMLFIFDAKDNTPAFWMKGMLIPLDIIWIKDGKITKIDKNIPAPAPVTPENKLKTYSAGAVDYVLEVNAGFADTNSIKTGDGVTLSGI